MGFTKNTKNTKKHTLLLLFRLCLIVQCYEQKIITSKNITKSVVICTSRWFENFVPRRQQVQAKGSETKSVSTHVRPLDIRSYMIVYILRLGYGITSEL